LEINKEKMEELLELIEELVVNKIRIEKVKDETKGLEIKRVLGQEVQIVSKIQEVVKKIQSESMKTIYNNLENYFGKKFIGINLNGEDAEFDNYNEKYIFNMLLVFIQDAFAGDKNDINNKVKVSAHNDSANLIIEILSKKTSKFEQLLKKHENNTIELTSLGEGEIDDWIKDVYIDGKAMNGTVELVIEDELNQRIIITIPLTSSIIKAQLVEINHQTYAIPIDCIEKVMNVDSAQKRVSGNMQLINYMKSIIPVIPIDKTLGFNYDYEISNYVVLKFKSQMKVLPVNLLLEQTDVVVRPKPKILQNVKEFKGMAVLGDGDVTMVFDIAYLLGNQS